MPTIPIPSASGRCARALARLMLGLIAVGANTAAAQQSSKQEPASHVEEILIIGEVLSGDPLDSGSSSVTSFDADTLAALHVADISDLALYTPNLNIVTAGTTSPTFFIRGVGLNDFAVTSSGAISIYQADVPLNSSAIQLGRIFDVENVSVVRGPQGTGSFRNASGGAIKIYPRKPSGDVGGYVNASLGNYEYLDLEGAFETPILEDLLSLRVAFGFTDRDGYVRNRCAGAPPIDQRVPRSGGSDTDPQWSFCGEGVRNNQISPLPVGLPKWLNRENNWALRGISVFTPVLSIAERSIDTEWTLNLHGARVDDDSALGQAIGTDRLLTRTPNEPGGLIVDEGLGGFDRLSYRDADIRDRSDELFAQLLAQCGALCQPPTPPAERNEARRTVSFERNRILSEEVASLDEDPWAGAYNRVGATTNDTLGGSLKGDLSLSEATTLTLIGGYEQWDRLVDIDLDFTPNTAFHLATEDEGFQITGEASLEHYFDTAMPVTASVGALGLYEDLDVMVTNDFGTLQVLSVGARIFDQQIISGSAFAKMDIELSETFILSGGGRYNIEKKKIDYLLTRTGSSLRSREDVTWDEPTGMIQLAYAPTEDISFYTKFTRGWKSGNYNATGNLRSGVTRADPEEITAYEIGFDFSFFDSRLDLRGAFFFYDYDNYQIFTSDNNLGSNPEFVTINASAAENYGAELEATITPWEGFQADVTFGWLESQFLDFTQQQLNQTQIGLEGVLFVTEIDYSGNRLLNSPQFVTSLIVSQQFELGRFGTLKLIYDAAWTDDYFFDPSEGRGIPNSDEISILPELSIGQEAYWLHGFGIDWSPAESGVKVSGWVRNITDEAYKTFSLDANTFQDTTIHFVGEPRTYGVTIGFEF